MRPPGLTALKGIPLAWQLIALVVGGMMIVNVAVVSLLMEERRGALSEVIFSDLGLKLSPSVEAFAAFGPLPESQALGSRFVLLRERPRFDQPLRTDNRVNRLLAARLAPVVVETGLRLGRAEEAWIPAANRGVLTPVVVVIARRADGAWLLAEAVAPPVPVFPLYLLTATLVYGLLVCCALVLAVRRITRPMQDLASAAAQIGRNQAIQPVPETGPVEVRVAARSFNAMAVRLQELVGRQRATLWALGHDMRTPLTAMRLHIEMLDAESDRAALLRGYEALDRVVDDALWLARAGTDIRPFELVDLAAVTESAVAAARAASPAQAHRLRPDPSDALLVRGRSHEIERAVRNLIENALAHGGPAICIQAAILSETEASVMVSDNGPGFPEAVLAEPGKPFLRGDEARTTPGTGLGLAIARAVSESLGGRLVLGTSGEGGALATIILSRADG